jgi:hypothetical protein
MSACPPRGRVRAALVGGAMLATALGASSCGSGGGTDDGPAHGSAEPASAPLYADPASRGGKCDDDRSAADARSPKTPWCTVAHALAAAGPDGVVALRGGTYDAIAVTGVRRSTWATLAPARGEHVVVRHGLTVQGSSHVRIRGLALRSTTTSSSVMSSDHVALEDNDVAGEGLVVRAVAHVTIAGNVIHDLQRRPGSEGLEGYGIWANANATGAPSERLTDLVVRDNTFRGIPQDGVQVGGGPARVARITIAGNRFSDVVRRQPEDHSDAIQIMGGAKITISGNHVTHAEECVLVGDDVTRELVIENNVMIGSPHMGNCVQVFQAPGARIVNNTFWQQAAGWPQALVIGTGDAPVTVANNIVNRYQVQDPAGAAALRQDYNLIVTGPRVGRHDAATAPRLTRGWRLAPGSAGIDAADAAVAPSRDRLGRKRRDDPAVANRGAGRERFTDIGAYER